MRPSWIRHICGFAITGGFPHIASSDEVLLKKRTLIESVIRELKTQTQVEHSRDRSVENFHVNVFSALIAYQLLENKPALNIYELQQTHDLPMLDIP